MEYIKGYKLEEQEDGYILTVYLNEYDVEFADENGKLRSDQKEKVYDNILSFIKDKFSGYKIKACKIALGSLILASIPMAGMGGGAYAAEANMNYNVKAGDSLWKIARQYDTSVSTLKSLNDLKGDTIYVDQIIKVPKATTGNNQHTVRTGDTLWSLARKYGTSVSQLKAINNLNTDTIYANQVLQVPGAGTAEKAPAATTATNQYTVKAGDNLYRLAKNYNTSISNIKAINNLKSDTIYPGQVLKVPGTSATTTTQKTTAKPNITYEKYTVKSGDNLWSISIAHGIPQSELIKANNFNENTQLSVGQVITVPVHNVPVKPTQGEQYGEYLDWWTEAQYVVPINKVVTVTDLETGQSFQIKRTIGANHADCEPLTANDTQVAKNIWGGYSWKTRPVTISVDGRKIAASMSFMPHGIQYIENNNFNGHFDVHFLNSTRHKDGQIDQNHQNDVKEAAGITGA